MVSRQRPAHGASPQQRPQRERQRTPRVRPPQRNGDGARCPRSRSPSACGCGTPHATAPTQQPQVHGAGAAHAAAGLGAVSGDPAAAGPSPRTADDPPRQGRSKLQRPQMHLRIPQAPSQAEPPDPPAGGEVAAEVVGDHRTEDQPEVRADNLGAEARAEAGAVAGEVAAGAGEETMRSAASHPISPTAEQNVGGRRRTRTQGAAARSQTASSAGPPATSCAPAPRA